MDNIVTTHDRQAVTTSLQIAETFGKTHRHVLRGIDDLKKDVSNFGQMFFEDNFPDSYGRDRRGYYLNRDGFTLLVMGFTGEKAMHFKLEYIQAFNAMEIEIQSGFRIPQNLPEALRLAADQQDKIDKLQPKAEYFDRQMHNPGLMTTTVIAKAYGGSAKWLNSLLKALGIIFRQGDHWVIKAKYAGEGYTGYDNWSDLDNQSVHPLLKWTQKGQHFIYEQLKANGILPVSEQMALLAE